MTKAAAKQASDTAKEFEYPGASLEQHWARLHRGDCEPYPAADALAKLVAAHPGLDPPMPIEKAAHILQDAWRAFHHGDFQESERVGLSIGRLGYNVANKAANIRATYLEKSEKKKLAALQASAHRAAQLQEHAPGLSNAWYLHAQALGRYAQGLSVVQALAQGIAGKVKSSLDTAIKLAPHHADAHIALGAYNAEVIDKIGALVGRLTYGASTDAALRHFEKALKLNPDSAVARIEYANGLLLMFGDAKAAKATQLYEDAAKCRPADAMEQLDVALAQSELED
jgi:tetratricopeptide (TPR) repeat protein